jgi:cytidine deaminase
VATGVIVHTLPGGEGAGYSDFSTAVMRNITDVQWQALEEAARAASAHAYCPYSRFPVGAAVLTADGSIAVGCNVENASFGLTCCAERNAIFRAVADGAKSIVALVLYTPTAEAVTPCGACRQVLAEFGRDAQVRCICDGPGGFDCIAHELLPHGFTLAKPAQAP